MRAVVVDDEPLARDGLRMLLAERRRDELLALVPALNVELAGLYWHFVDVVWIVIFTLVYLLPE